MKYNEFSRLIACAKDMIKATNYIFQQVDKPDDLPQDIYYSLVMMHNSCIDYIVAIEESKKKEEK